MLNLLVTAPHSMQSRLNQIVINILAQLHTTPDQTNITYIVQLTPPNMCGYAVAKDIFDRLEIGIPPVAEQTQQCLIQSQYQGTIHRIQQDDRQVWISSGASEDLRLLRGDAGLFSLLRSSATTSLVNFLLPALTVICVL